MNLHPKALKDSPLHASTHPEQPNPTTLDEAVKAIDGMLNEETRLFLSVANEKTAVTELHHTLGRYLRNKWGLWQGSPLAKHMEQVHGASHVDDMSSMIISAYCRRGIQTRFQRVLSEDSIVECNLEEAPSSPG
jgi:hypothetical protein